MRLIAARGELVDTEAPATDGQSGKLVGIFLLVDVGLDGERLLIIPEVWARRELRSYVTRCSARSYRDVLADDDVVETHGIGELVLRARVWRRVRECLI